MKGCNANNAIFLLSVSISLLSLSRSNGFSFAGIVSTHQQRHQQRHQHQHRHQHSPTALGAKGFGGSGGGGGGGGFGTRTSSSSNNNNNNKKKKKKGRPSLQEALNDTPSSKYKSNNKNRPYIKSEQDDAIQQLAKASSNTVIGQAVASSPYTGTPNADPFWELMPSLIRSRFPSVKDSQLLRVAGMIRHALEHPDKKEQHLDQDIIDNPHRPHHEIHAYMPGLGPQNAPPFLEPSTLQLCQTLSQNYHTIRDEYHALLDDALQNGQDRFQSVTSMNYDSGWRTLVLFYNGHRIQGFPYHLCPVTTQIMETVPLAGRIAGFNRQQPKTGIPRHSDGNNMWLTCQMGIHVPGSHDDDDDNHNSAWIRVGPETRHWEEGQCLLYDTTYEHETFNDHPEQERVVLHVDFFNTLTMTPVEIEIMRYIYQLREEFMKAEGVAKVGAQIL